MREKRKDEMRGREVRRGEGRRGHIEKGILKGKSWGSGICMKPVYLDRRLGNGVIYNHENRCYM